jgi:hypothetical protein
MSGGGLRIWGIIRLGFFLGRALLDWGICWREFELGSRANDQYRGHRFAGGFGHGGQDIHMVSWS